MALTIVRYPGSYYDSINNEVIYVFEEPTKTADPITYPNYKFILDVYTGAGVFLGKLKTAPHPTTKLGIFDVSSIIQQLPDYSFSMASNKVDYDHGVEILVKGGEEYGDTEYLDIAIDAPRKIWKHYKRRPFIGTETFANRIASLMPSAITVLAKGSSLYQLVPYLSNVSGVTDLTITYKNDAGTTLSTSTVSNSDFVAYKVRQYNIPNSNPNATQAVLSGPFNLTINYECTKYDVKYIAWLNSFGAYDSFSFGLVSMKTVDTERKAFSRLPYEVSGAGDIDYLDNNVFYGQKRGFSATNKTRVKLTSHLLTEDEYTWLADLFASPSVFIYLDSLGWEPVQITSNSYEYRNYLNSRLKPLEFEVLLSDDYNSQLL